MRDFQQHKVYTSENFVAEVLKTAVDNPQFDFFGSTLTLPPERKFGTVENVQDYVNRVLLKLCPSAPPIKVRPRKGTAKAEYEPWDSTIAIPVTKTWALRELVVLHEIAHHLSRGDHHGPVFAGRFLALVREVIGPEVSLLLTWSFDQHGVKMSPCYDLTTD